MIKENTLLGKQIRFNFTGGDWGDEEDTIKNYDGCLGKIIGVVCYYEPDYFYVDVKFFDGFEIKGVSSVNLTLRLKKENKIEYKKAGYESIMKCPECGFLDIPSEDDMPDRDAIMSNEDDDGVEYYQCPCGCKFVK